jgi:hypothetical protein
MPLTDEVRPLVQNVGARLVRIAGLGEQGSLASRSPRSVPTSSR